MSAKLTTVNLKKMSDVDIEILKEFQTESKDLINQMMDILELCEQANAQEQSLEQYGQLVDRIMGGAKSLALQVQKDHLIHKIGDYAAICKAVGYKASQLKNNHQFFEICVALLLDATEMLILMIDSITIATKVEIKDLLSKTFLDRLRWVSDQFGTEYRASVDVKKGQEAKKMDQSEIDDLLKKLGL